MRLLIPPLLVRPLLVRTPLVRTPLARTPLARTPLARTPLVRTPLARTPLARTPLARTPLARTPLARTPLARTPLVPTLLIPPLLIPPLLVRTLLVTILPLLLLLPGCGDEEDDQIARVGALVRDRDLDGLAALLDSEDTALKCRAASSLAWVKGEDAIRHHRFLVSWTDCGWKIQAEAAWRMAEEEAPDAAKVAKSLLQSKDEHLRWNGASILAELTRPDLRDTLNGCKTAEGQEKFLGLWCDYGLCLLDGGRCSRPKMRTWEESDDH